METSEEADGFGAQVAWISSFHAFGGLGILATTACQLESRAFLCTPVPLEIYSPISRTLKGMGAFVLLLLARSRTGNRTCVAGLCGRAPSNYPRTLQYSDCWGLVMVVSCSDECFLFFFGGGPALLWPVDQESPKSYLSDAQ